MRRVSRRARSRSARGNISIRIIHKILQLFARLEKRNLLRRHIHLPPVLGFLPIRPRRCRVRKLPNPRISILSPFCSASMMLSKIVSTMVSDSFRGSSEMRSTSSIRSAFVNVGCLLIINPVSPARNRPPYLPDRFAAAQIGLRNTLSKYLFRNGLERCPASRAPFLSLNQSLRKCICLNTMVPNICSRNPYRPSFDFSASPIVAVDDDFEVDVDRYWSISRRSCCFTAAR